MIGLATNVLVRYLTEDDPVQSPRAIELIEHHLTVEDPGFITVVAMAETVWVLAKVYRFTVEELAAAVERMLAAETLLVECEQQVFEAMIALRQGQGTFADALIGALCRRAGCLEIATFDRAALRLPGFVAV